MIKLVKSDKRQYDINLTFIRIRGDVEMTLPFLFVLFRSKWGWEFPYPDAVGRWFA